MDYRVFQDILTRVKAEAFDHLAMAIEQECHYQFHLAAGIPQDIPEPKAPTPAAAATEPEEVVVVPAPTPIAAPSRRRKYPGAVTTTPEPILPQPEPISLVADDEAPF